MSRLEMGGGAEFEDSEESVEGGQGERVASDLKAEFPGIRSRSFNELLGLIEDHYV